MSVTSGEAYPRAARYDLGWLLDLDMGPNPLVQAEALLPDLGLRPGQRVLDLGCGLGATSVFLARECDVEVVAVDLWVDEQHRRRVLEDADVRDRVRAVRADARRLPFADDSFDAVISVDAWEYFGTAAAFLSTLLRVVRPGGRIAMSTPALADDPADHEPPAAVQALVGEEVAGWHAPAWWVRHWQSSGLVGSIEARFLVDGHHHWLEWSRLLGEGSAATTAMLEQVSSDQLGFALVSATKLGNDAARARV